MTWYRFFQLLATPFAYAVARLEVVGKENIPGSGPFVLVANHQSILDPILVQVVCPRPLHTLTKSTQFGGTFMGWLMPRINAIPTRRYRIDPQAVRVVLRRLAQGEGVGVYPEGERSWDAGLQPFRRGTIRMLLKAGVPIIPCGVTGSYDVWPRWSRGIRRRPVRVEFGSALLWPALHRRQERDLELPAATETLRLALASLTNHPGGSERSTALVPVWLEGVAGAVGGGQGPSSDSESRGESDPLESTPGWRGQGS